MSDRNLPDVIATLMKVIPGHLAAERSALQAAATSSLYQSPENQRPAWLKAQAAIEACLGKPPLSGWRAEARTIWMGEALQ